MPPRQFSRHQFCQLVTDDLGRRVLTDRVPFRYADLSDNRRHLVNQGETLFTLAGKYFAGLPRAAGLWWVIADFQPTPIHDPTIALAPGTVVFVPSSRTVLETIMSEKRREVSVL